jgi:hypothetical protein
MLTTDLETQTTVSYAPPPAGIAVGPRAGAPPWRWSQRVVAIAVGAMLVGLLVTAARLTPSSAGLGTHQQLGLPPCTVVDWFEIRCPSCGMTTSWAHMVRGHVLAALRANAGGAMLAIVAATCGPWLVGSGVRGRWLIGRPAEEIVLGMGLTIIVVTLVQWTLRLSLGW